MPSRILKESIWTSPNLDKLSMGAERHFYRLLPLPDDYGCFESTPAVVRGRCYPLKSGLRSDDIIKWQDELDTNGLIARWTFGGREYAIFCSWDRHQYVRNGPHQRRTPEPPPEIMERCGQLLSAEGCGGLRDASETYGFNPDHNPNHKCSPKPQEKENIKEKERMVFEDNVYLTKDEYDKLVEKFGEPGTRKRIEALSLYMKSKGKRYKDHYATILAWERLNQTSGPEKFVSGKYGDMVQR